MDARQVAVTLIILGIVAILLGLLVAAGWLSWFGRLPGDVRIESGSSRIYFPVTSMIVVSIALTIAVNVVRRWL